MTSAVRIARGALHISAALYAERFSGVEGVALLRRERALVILPVRHVLAGGFLLKQRNLAGDRVVDAPEFFRSNGVPEHETIDCMAAWSDSEAALVVADLFQVHT